MVQASHSYVKTIMCYCIFHFKCLISFYVGTLGDLHLPFVACFLKCDAERILQKHRP